MQRGMGGLLAALLACGAVAADDVIDVQRSIRVLENPTSELNEEDFRLIDQAKAVGEERRPIPSCGTSRRVGGWRLREPSKSSSR